MNSSGLQTQMKIPFLDRIDRMIRINKPPRPQGEASKMFSSPLMGEDLGEVKLYPFPLPDHCGRSGQVLFCPYIAPSGQKPY